MSAQSGEGAVLFDLDGTLTNPFTGITNCIAYALERMGEAVPDPATLDWCIGPPLWDSFRVLLSNPDEGRVNDAVAIYRERYGEVGKFENELIEGVPEALEAIAGEQDLPFFVATSKLERYSEHIIDHFDLRRFFRTVHGSQHDGTNAHKPELLAHILKTENLSASQTVMIGDRKHDIIGAKANNVRSIGVLWGFGAREELEEAGADIIVEKSAQLPSAVDALLAA
ncbi:HAD-IA family hydrolase [Nitratireductor sp. CH_MIT9313-5]|jgi:phosphoglycolate phosphatase|uniref:HAD-IA family hydrolase n=1 Tax=Nitratireductor sp. CH_MIT9313-5 TaxID=3107764 RepID=UPI0030095EFD